MVSDPSCVRDACHPLRSKVQMPAAESSPGAGLPARAQTLGFFRQRLLVTPRRCHHHQLVLVGLDSIFAAESFLKIVKLPLVKSMMIAVMVMPAGSYPTEVGLASAVTLARLAAKRRILTAVSGLIARQTEDCHTLFHQM